MKPPKDAAVPIEAWHALRVEKVSQRLGTRLTGLTDTEATERLARYGLNRLTPPRRRGPVMRFLLQFHNVLIYVLLAAAGVTALLGHWLDTGVIVGVVLINAIIGFIQEGKAERALEAIRNLLSPQATVLCEGKHVMLPAEELVPGDVVVLHSGDKVPADLRLLWTKTLRVDEAMLTGESVPVDKSSEPVPAETPLADRTCIAYAGTLVTYGQGHGIVVATGDLTEVGRISALLREVETLTTPLLRQMAGFSRWLTAAIMAVAAAVFLFGTLVRGQTAMEMFLAAVALAVAAIPEGLPAILTITLAIGVQRMARRNAIIRRLPVSPHGGFSLEGRELAIAEASELIELGRAGLLCNDADIHQEDSSWRLHGDPTEGALVALAMKAGLDPHLQRQDLPRIDVIPFESEHQFMATLHHDHAGHAFMYVKGAPERVFAMCHAQRSQGENHPLDLGYWHRQVEAIAQRGERTLAVGFKLMPAAQNSLRFEDVESGLTLLGLFGIADPPREEAILAVRECQEAGIRVKMITGDHVLTACAIGKKMGIGAQGRALSGADLDRLYDEDLRAVVQDVDVFARATPEHKLRLVQALQADQQVVAMTGDGVNDAPALKRADIGVAMGQKGTEVAKEAAEMVLADDNFASIAHAVEEGRTVYDNLQKAILFILPTNGGEALLLIAAIALGDLLPITAVQILWVNMITAVTLALALAFEPPESDVMGRPPRSPGAPLLTGFLTWRIAFVSVVLVAGTFGLFHWYYSQGAAIEYARTVAVNTLIMFEAFYLLNSRYLRAPVLSRKGLFGNRWVIVAIAAVIGLQLLFSYAPPMQALFGTVGLTGQTWVGIVGVAAWVFVLVELEKLLGTLRRAQVYKRSLATEATIEV